MSVSAEFALGALGPRGDYCNGALMAFASAADWFGQDDRGYQRERAALLRARARQRPAAHAHAGEPAGEPRGRCLGAAQPDTRGPHRRPQRQRHRDSGRAHPRDDRPLRRRDPRHALDGAQRRARGRALLLRVRNPVRRARPALPLSRGFDLGRSHFDHPLASRFEEIDAIVMFDDVLVPWERCFSSSAARSSATRSTPRPAPPCT